MKLFMVCINKIFVVIQFAVTHCLIICLCVPVQTAVQRGQDAAGVTFGLSVLRLNVPPGIRPIVIYVLYTVRKIEFVNVQMIHVQ